MVCREVWSAANLPTTETEPMTALRSARLPAALLLAAALLGLGIANSPFGEAVIGLWDTAWPVPALGIDLSIGHWISELLLAVFFFLIAVELKRELTVGELNSPSKALLPAIAAAGGVLVPVLLYLLLSGTLNGSGLGRGWPIPTATDIAFALGVLAAFGSGLPPRIRAFLLALAVLDDLIGIIIIATVFAGEVNLIALIGGLVAAALFGLASRRHAARYPWWQTVLLVALALVSWYLVLRSGVHPTMAGVALGIAMSRRGGERAAHRLEPASNGVILPLFAFSAALVVLPAGGASTSPVFLALLIALPLGKLIGVTIGGLLGVLIARKTAATALTGWDLIAVAALAGIGFTVALLMNELAFGARPEVADSGVLAVLAGSVFSAVLGGALIAWRARVYRRTAAATDTA